MLSHLALTNVALIESLDLPLTAGFTVITGETGAGKSLLLDGLGLALGQRADAALIRSGCTTAEATATFTLTPTPQLTAFLESQGIEISNEITLRRQLKLTAGTLTSKAWLCGTPVPVTILAQAAEMLVDVHAQHASQQLFSPSAQTALIDELAGATTLAQQVASAHSAWQQALKHRTELQSGAQQQAAMATLTQGWLDELKALHYQAGEELTLAEQRANLANAALISQQLTLADQALSTEGGALTALQAARRALDHAAKVSEALQPLAARLHALVTEAQDVAYDLARAMPTDPTNIEEIDDRLHTLRAIARKHRVDISQLAQVYTDLQTQAQQWNNLDAAIADAEAAEHKAHSTLIAAAKQLTIKRQQATGSLSAALQTALTALHLPHAKLEIQLISHQSPITSQGAEKIEIMFSANPGQPLAPLAKTASGGELSRAMLAIKSILFQGLSTRTIVLDEVDTGTSGPTAAAIGAAMSKLAQQHQVLTITHHPQVAAHAAQHLFLTKSIEGQQTRTHLRELTPDQRVTELARLLAGNHVTPQARAAAQALLAETQQNQAA